MDLQNLLETIVNTVLIPAIPIVVGAVVQYVRTKTEGSKIEEAVGIVLIRRTRRSRISCGKTEPSRKKNSVKRWKNPSKPRFP